MTDTPKTWGQMTDAERGALLLAHHNRKEIQSYSSSDTWERCFSAPSWSNNYAYRVKPEPVRETVVRYFEESLSAGLAQPYGCIRLTVDKVDGRYDWSTLRGEYL